MTVCMLSYESGDFFLEYLLGYCPKSPSLFMTHHKYHLSPLTS